MTHFFSAVVKVCLLWTRFWSFIKEIILKYLQVTQLTQRLIGCLLGQQCSCWHVTRLFTIESSLFTILLNPKRETCVRAFDLSIADSRGGGLSLQSTRKTSKGADGGMVGVPVADPSKRCGGHHRHHSFFCVAPLAGPHA